MITVKRTKRNAPGDQTPGVSTSTITPRQTAWEIQKAVDPSRVLNHFQAKRERAAAKAYIEGSQAQRPTAKQVVKLSAELGYPGRAGMVAFIRYANAYSAEPPFTRGHFVAAIDLATRGRNHWGSLDALDQLTRLEGPLWTGHGENGASNQWKRKPNASRGKRSNP